MHNNWYVHTDWLTCSGCSIWGLTVGCGRWWSGGETRCRRRSRSASASTTYTSITPRRCWTKCSMAPPCPQLLLSQVSSRRGYLMVWLPLLHFQTAAWPRQVQACQDQAREGHRRPWVNLKTWYHAGNFQNLWVWLTQTSIPLVTTSILPLTSCSTTYTLSGSAGQASFPFNTITHVVCWKAEKTSK